MNLGDTSSSGRYVQTSGTTYYFNATMLMSTTNGQSVVTVTLGTNVGSGPLRSVPRIRRRLSNGRPARLPSVH